MSAATAASWHRSLRRLVGDEGGSALLIALVMVFVISLVATAVLSYTGTSLTASKSVVSDRKSLYAADGAIDTAIRRLADASNNAQCGDRPDGSRRQRRPDGERARRRRGRRPARDPRRLHPREPAARSPGR